MELLMKMRGSPAGPNQTAEAQETKKYLYNLSTAKYMRGYDLLYREKEYQYWFMGNINYLIQFYSLWRRQPTEMMSANREQWYEWTQAKGEALMVHAPVAGFITDLKKDLLFSGPVTVRINNNDELNSRLQEALQDNDFQNFLKHAKTLESWGGTIVIKANFDRDISDYPLLEVYEAPKIDYKEQFNRITAIETIDLLAHNGREYTLVAEHTRKGIEYKLFRDANPVPRGEVPALEEVEDLTYPENTRGPILAIWKQNTKPSKEFYDLKLGASDYEGLIDNFQMADEIYSRFIGQIRATQPILFMSEELMGFRQDPSTGEMYINRPRDLGFKVYELSGGLSNVDGRSIQAMFNRDVPKLEGVKELQEAFEWILRQTLKFLGIAPISGNIETESVGSNTTSTALFKREQSTHLVRKADIESWEVAIKDIVRLVCQYFDLMDGKEAPGDYKDLDIDVMFPELDADDLETRVNIAIKLFAAGLFDIKSGVEHAFKYALPEQDRNRIADELEKQRLEEIERQERALKTKGDGQSKETARRMDAVVKASNLGKESQEKEA